VKWDTSDDVSQTLAQVIQVRPARLKSDLNLRHLDSREAEVVDQWFANSLGKSYHIQVKEIALALRALPLKASFDRIAMIFNLKLSTMSKHIEDKDLTGIARGRPPTLNVDEIDRIKKFIRASYDENHPAKYSDVYNFIVHDIKRIANMDTVRRVVKAMDEFRCLIDVPMERERVNADAEEIEHFYEQLELV
jgi:hypothetical protein